MSAVFEISMFIKKINNYNIFTSISQYFNSKFTIEKIIVIDNWEFENQFEIDSNTNNDEIVRLVNISKIVMFYGYLNSIHWCGFNLERLNNNVYYVNLWISTKELPFLDKDYVSCEDEYIYKFITNYVADKINNDLILCGIGVECCISYNDIITNIIQSGHNVNGWILPRKMSIQINNYSKTEISDYYVYLNTIKDNKAI